MAVGNGAAAVGLLDDATFHFARVIAVLHSAFQQADNAGTVLDFAFIPAAADGGAFIFHMADNAGRNPAGAHIALVAAVPDGSLGDSGRNAAGVVVPSVGSGIFHSGLVYAADHFAVVHIGRNTAHQTAIAGNQTPDRAVPNLAQHTACDASNFEIRVIFFILTVPGDCGGHGAVEMAVFHRAVVIDLTGNAARVGSIFCGGAEVAIHQRQIADAAFVDVTEEAIEGFCGILRRTVNAANGLPVSVKGAVVTGSQTDRYPFHNP